MEKGGQKRAAEKPAATSEQRQLRQRRPTSYRDHHEVDDWLEAVDAGAGSGNGKLDVQVCGC